MVKIRTGNFITIIITLITADNTYTDVRDQGKEKERESEGVREIECKVEWNK